METLIAKARADMDRDLASFKKADMTDKLLLEILWSNYDWRRAYLMGILDAQKVMKNANS